LGQWTIPSKNPVIGGHTQISGTEEIWQDAITLTGNGGTKKKEAQGADVQIRTKSRGSDLVRRGGIQAKMQARRLPASLKRHPHGDGCPQPNEETFVIGRSASKGKARGRGGISYRKKNSLKSIEMGRRRGGEEGCPDCSPVMGVNVRPAKQERIALK